MNRAPDFSSQVAEQAVHWLMEMQQGALSPRQQLAWQQWLDAHSEHRRAWEHIQRVNQRLRGVSSPLAHAALNGPKSGSRRQALKLLLILGAGSAATWGLREHNPLPSLLADYRSPIGQRRKIALGGRHPVATEHRAVRQTCASMATSDSLAGRRNPPDRRATRSKCTPRRAF